MSAFDFDPERDGEVVESFENKSFMISCVLAGSEWRSVLRMQSVD